MPTLHLKMCDGPWVKVLTSERLGLPIHFLGIWGRVLPFGSRLLARNAVQVTSTGWPFTSSLIFLPIHSPHPKFFQKQRGKNLVPMVRKGQKKRKTKKYKQTNKQTNRQTDKQKQNKTKTKKKHSAPSRRIFGLYIFWSTFPKKKKKGPRKKI